VNTKNSSIYPYRRGGGGGKRRGKGGPPGNGGGHPGGNRQRNANLRRVPGSPGDLLNQLQPATKALAQMLAGNTRSSGQLVHARNVLTQAQKAIDDRQVDRLPPSMREEFLEQVARLRLTISDAAVSEGEAVARAEEREAAPAQEPVTMDRLRELALQLAASTDEPSPGLYVEPEEEAEEEKLPLPQRHYIPERASEHGGEASANDEDEPAPTSRTGKTRERLRLKSVVRSAADS